MSDAALRKRLAQAAGWTAEQARGGKWQIFDADGRTWIPIWDTEDEGWEWDTLDLEKSTDAALQLAWDILPPDYGIYLSIFGNATMVEVREDEDGRLRARGQAEGEYHTPRAICLALASWLDWYEALPTEDAQGD